VTEAAIGEAVERIPAQTAALVPHTITEWDLPEQADFPHDLRLDGRGNVLVTGTFSGLMYVLDPRTAEFSTVKIPLDMANPRALDVDRDGNWWVMCGAPKKVARYTVATKQWDVFDIGMYPHSTMVDAKNRVWFNGHFTNKPILIGFLDGTSGEVSTIEVPANPMPASTGGPIPYGLRVAPDGTVWSTELAGNRLVHLNPATGIIKTYTMPTTHSGPRRLDVGPDGAVWIPEFARGRLAHFDPKSEALTEHNFPTANSLPYCARVDHRRGYVWISQCANDAIARFDPRTETFTEFRLPTRMAFIRHLDVDSETGEVWATYSHSPGMHPRVVRLKVD
jgi:streptogramin lyase